MRKLMLDHQQMNVKRNFSTGDYSKWVATMSGNVVNVCVGDIQSDDRSVWC